MSTHAAKLIGRANHPPESSRAGRYPISRWYLRPAADRLAAVLAPTRIRPVHVTFCGLLAATAAGVLLWRPEWMPAAAALVLLYWFFDRCDGLLARRQNAVTPFGAWLDANVDELVDIGLHVVVAAVAARGVAAPWPWFLLIGFVAGKHLLMYGLTSEEANGPPQRVPPPPSARLLPRFLRRIYHLPANADVRLHLLVLALATGYLAAELALVAVYYNLRWPVRYLLVARRLGGTQ